METESVKITEEQANLILGGIRPKDMDFTKFKEYRSRLKKLVKTHLKGRFFFISSTIDNKGKRITKTYYKDGNKLSNKGKK